MWNASSGKCLRTSPITSPLTRRAHVVHGHEHPRDPQAGVEVLLHRGDRLHQPRKPLQGVVLALDRHDQPVGGREGVDGEQVERRRAVHEDEGVARRDAGRAPSRAGARGPARPGSSTAAPARSGRRGDAGPGWRPAVGDHGLADRQPVEQDFGRSSGRPVPATPRPLVALAWGSTSTSSTRAPGLGEAGGKVDRGGGLPDAALLVRDGVDHGLRPRPAGGGAARPARRGKRLGVGRRPCGRAARWRRGTRERACYATGSAGSRPSTAAARAAAASPGSAPSPRHTTDGPAHRDQRGRQLQRHGQRERGRARGDREGLPLGRRQVLGAIGHDPDIRERLGCPAQPVGLAAARSRPGSPPSPGGRGERQAGEAAPRCRGRRSALAPAISGSARPPRLSARWRSMPSSRSSMDVRFWGSRRDAVEQRDEGSGEPPGRARRPCAAARQRGACAGADVSRETDGAGLGTPTGRRYSAGSTMIRRRGSSPSLRVTTLRLGP